MDQNRTPVFDGLVAYTRRQHYSFHVPGHKDGLVFPERAASFFKPLLALDATEVADLDDLYRPTGMLRDAEALLADYYGTRSSYFLVNGSTIGNLVMMLATCRRGDTVLVQRDSHKSVFNALRLAGARPVFLAPETDAKSGLAVGVTPQAWASAFRRFPEARALVLTYPNYYGMAASGVRSMIEAAHRRGMAVLVDEAHGAHFKMGPPLPPSTLDLGADLVVHSAHKMLPAMTMGAWLHIHSSRISAGKVEAAIQLLQTSSPSYVIMASLDLARWLLANMTGREREKIFAARDAFVDALKRLDGVSMLEARPGDGRFTLDPFKLTLTAENLESGFDWQKRLIAFGIYPELADPRHVLFTLGLTSDIDYSRAVRLIGRSLEGGVENDGAYPSSSAAGGCLPATATFPFPEWSTLALPYEELDLLGREEVRLKEAAGRIAAEHVIPYPPGIPAIIHGERITKAQLEAVDEWRQAGAVFQNERTHFGRIHVYR